MNLLIAVSEPAELNSVASLAALLDASGHGVERTTYDALDRAALECGAEVILVDATSVSEIASLIAAIRRKSDVPVIVMSDRADEAEVVLALRVGADDHLAKPIRLLELLARIDRRARGAAPLRHGTGVRSVGPLLIDEGARKVKKNGAYVRIGPQEFSLLRVLARTPGRPVSRHELAAELRPNAGLPRSRSIDVMVVALRRKLEDDPANPKLLLTVHGIGYALAG
jgi:two-component system, OmpR family, KDP operon response regulator KdpE